MKIWKYIGQGQWIIGVPAKDLSEEEIKSLGIDPKILRESGLYKEISDSKMEYSNPKPSEVKDGRN